MEDGGNEQQRGPFSPGLASFAPRVVLAVFIVPSQSTQVYLERKLEALPVDHHDRDTGFGRARDITRHSLGMHWACTCFLQSGLLQFESLVRVNKRKRPKRRCDEFNWQDVDI